MALRNLNHITIRAADLEATRRFYEEVIGLEVGPRPSFRFPGHWLYLGETPVVHLVGVAGAEGRAAGGAVDHIAFEASGLAETRARLQAKDVPFTERTVPGPGLRQLFLEDPNGVAIELQFPAEEAAETAA